MTITTTWQTRTFDPAAVKSRYVRLKLDRSGYEWCEVGEDRRYDLRRGDCDATDIPGDIRERADQLAGMVYRYVDWPIEKG